MNKHKILIGIALLLVAYVSWASVYLTTHNVHPNEVVIIECAVTDQLGNDLLICEIEDFKSTRGIFK